MTVNRKMNYFNYNLKTYNLVIRKNKIETYKKKLRVKFKMKHLIEIIMTQKQNSKFKILLFYLRIAKIR